VTQAGYRPDPYDAPEGPHHASVALYLILSLLTLGLFNLYWNWRQMRACNELLGRKAFSWVLWIVFCVLTLGIYQFYYQYKMGSALNDIQRIVRMPVTDGLPVLSLAATLVGFGIVTDCIHQFELNRIDAWRLGGSGL
jgi:hypothetical protein